jgi:hypothetical protein
MEHSSNVSQSRLRVVKGKPLIQQANSLAPAFEVLAAFQPPVIASAR